MLAVSNIFAAWAPLSSRAEANPSDASAYFLLLARAAAGTLFLCGLITSTGTGQIRANSWAVWFSRFGIAAATSFGILAIGVVIAPFDVLPSLLDQPARDVMASHETVDFALPGQHVGLVLANAALGIVLLISAIGYTRAGHRLQDRQIGALAGGLSFLCFAQVHTIMVPAVSAQYVTSGDAFRFIAYALLLSSLMWRTAHEFAASASQSERLRLSRELHDGLAQQLAVLQLRLGRISEMTQPSDPRSRDLEVARVVLDSAYIEARGAIAALRFERIPWSDFEQVLLAFVDDFSFKHDVLARLSTDASDCPIDSQLEVDVLRIVEEASSNAVRHGHASHIDVSVTHEVQGLCVVVSDDGSGFDPAQVRRGVGLHSMTERAKRRGGTLVVDSAEGQLTRIEAHLRASAVNADSP